MAYEPRNRRQTGQFGQSPPTPTRAYELSEFAGPELLDKCPRIIYGLNPVREAIKVHAEKIGMLLVQKSENPKLAGISKLATDCHLEVRFVDRGVLDSLTKNADHQGVFALAPELRLVNASKAIKPGFLGVALDHIQDPQNFGAVIRCAVAFKSDLLLFPEHHSAPLSPATFRASAGQVERAPLSRAKNLAETLEAIKLNDVTVIGLDGNADIELADVDLTGSCCLVIGNEGKGLSRPVKKACDIVARLSIAGSVDSLNASVAAALSLYEAQRQRRGNSIEEASSEDNASEANSIESDSTE